MCKPKVTNAFLEQIRNILNNLFLPKFLYVTKGCLKNLARAKNAMRAQNPHTQVPDHNVLVPNQACRGVQTCWNRDLF